MEVVQIDAKKLVRQRFKKEEGTAELGEIIVFEGEFHVSNRKNEKDDHKSWETKLENWKTGSRSVTVFHDQEELYFWSCLTLYISDYSKIDKRLKHWKKSPKVV